uniref:Cadherin domain-containing protein n=1 Tax=Macrostomum lignano TaxID=282301 RepID=A0A1I8FA26_9PLAT
MGGGMRVAGCQRLEIQGRNGRLSCRIRASLGENPRSLDLRDAHALEQRPSESRRSDWHRALHLISSGHCTLFRGSAGDPPRLSLLPLLLLAPPAGTTLVANLTALSGSRWSKFSLLNSRDGRRVFRLDAAPPSSPSCRSSDMKWPRRLQCSGCSGDEDDSAVAAAVASDSDGSGGDSEAWPTCQCPRAAPRRCQPAADSAGRLQPRNNHAPEFVGVGVVAARDRRRSGREATVSISELAEVNGSAVAGLPVAAVDRDSARFGLRQFRLQPLDFNDTEAASMFELAHHACGMCGWRSSAPAAPDACWCWTRTTTGPPGPAGRCLERQRVRDLAPDGTTVTQLRAADPDAGANGRLSTCWMRRCPENQPAGRAACYLLASDRDSGANAAVTCSLQSGEEGDSGGGSFMLSLQSRMERGLPARHNPAAGPRVPQRRRRCGHRLLRGRRVVASPHRPPVARCRAGRERQPAELHAAIFQMQLDEELEPGTTIGRVKAVDVDEWPALNYSLLAGSDPDAEVVSVDSDSGLVRSRVRFDAQTRDRYQFQVMASDGVHAATALVELTIADRERPRAGVGRRFESAAFGSGRTPGQHAGGRGLRGQWPGGLPPGAARLGPAVRHPADGEVYVVAGGGLELDRERTPTLSLKADPAPERQPGDSGADRRERQLAAAAVPQLRRQPDRVSCRLPVGGWVARLRAADSDEGDNARLSFGIGEGPWREHFSVDASSGNLTLAKPLTCATSPERISLRVSAKDHGRPPRFTAGALWCRRSRRGSRRRPRGDRAGGPVARSDGSGDRSGVDGGVGGGGRWGADPGLAAVLCLIAATLLLAAILAFASALLRKRATGRGP